MARWRIRAQADLQEVTGSGCVLFSSGELTNSRHCCAGADLSQHPSALHVLAACRSLTLMTALCLNIRPIRGFGPSLLGPTLRVSISCCELVVLEGFSTSALTLNTIPLLGRRRRRPSSCCHSSSCHHICRGSGSGGRD